MTEQSRRRFPELDERELDPDPMSQFAHWFDVVLREDLVEPYAMTLATAGADGVPSARTVLLKGYDESGFLFFTNHQSRKGAEIAANPHAALVFYWNPLDRQVCVRGTVARLSVEESERYWNTRPRGSRLGAWASRQSEVLEDRDLLDRRLDELDRRFGYEIPLPEFWGGYRVTPVTMEFWQGRTNRLHDRFRYTRSVAEGWTLERLYP
jgi:pyridoxamine 5'-phosphate oxidase